MTWCIATHLHPGAGRATLGASGRHSTVTMYHTLYIEYTHYAPWFPRKLARHWILLDHATALQHVPRRDGAYGADP